MRLQFPFPLPAPPTLVESAAKVRGIFRYPVGLRGPDALSAAWEQVSPVLSLKGIPNAQGAAEEQCWLGRRTGDERRARHLYRILGRFGCLPSAASPALLSTGCASSGVILANSALTMWTVKWLLLYFVALSNISQRVGCTIWWTICLCAQQQYT